jgi:hypothetical protein
MTTAPRYSFELATGHDGLPYWRALRGQWLRPWAEMIIYPTGWPVGTRVYIAGELRGRGRGTMPEKFQESYELVKNAEGQLCWKINDGRLVGVDTALTLYPECYHVGTRVVISEPEDAPVDSPARPQAEYRLDLRQCWHEYFPSENPGVWGLAFFHQFVTTYSQTMAVLEDEYGTVFLSSLERVLFSDEDPSPSV